MVENGAQLNRNPTHPIVIPALAGMTNMGT